MYLEKIYIKNFRNIENESLNPSVGINLLFGNNAQGKTNFLEAIYVTSNLKSFRAKKNSEIINFDKNKATLNLKLNKNRVSNNITLELENDKKEIILNNKRTKKISKSLGFIDTILFYPDDIIIVKGSPLLRRNLIDRAIFQTDNSYLNLLQKYYHCLKQRNSSLKNGITDASLWDTQFSELATIITYYRISYIERINLILDHNFKEIYKYEESVKINIRFQKYLKMISKII